MQKICDFLLWKIFSFDKSLLMGDPKYFTFFQPSHFSYRFSKDNMLKSKIKKILSNGEMWTNFVEL